MPARRPLQAPAAPTVVATTDGSVRVFYRRGERLPADHPAVLARPAHFRAVEQRAARTVPEQRQPDAGVEIVEFHTDELPPPNPDLIGDIQKGRGQ